MFRKSKAAPFASIAVSLGLLAGGPAFAQGGDAFDRMSLHSIGHHRADSYQPVFGFVLGHGIVGEPCGLPASACPNDEHITN
jgi:hypothetical protein